MSKVKTIIYAFAAVIFMATSLQAQVTKKEAADAYNQGIGLIEKDTDAAIDSFERAVKLSAQVGDEANDIKENSGKVLPGLYYKRVVAFTNDKKYEESLVASKLAIESAEKYGNDKIKEETRKIMAQVYTNLGSGYYKANDQPNAIKNFDNALAINPDLYKVLFFKAVALSKLNDTPKYTEQIDLAIAKAVAANDTVYKKTTVEPNARAYFKNLATAANKAKKPAEAIAHLNTALKYGSDKDIFYQLANIQNSMKKYADAAVNAQKGLDLETGAPEAKAKFYYELAVAQLGKGEKDNACSNFKNSSFGPFLQASKAQMTNMKCPGAAPAPKAPAK